MRFHSIKHCSEGPIWNWVVVIGGDQTEMSMKSQQPESLTSYNESNDSNTVVPLYLQFCFLQFQLATISCGPEISNGKFRK